MTPLVMSVLAAIRQYKVEADGYVAVMNIQKLATPREVEELAGLSQLWPEPMRKIITDTDRQMRVGTEGVRQYKSERIGEHATLFRGSAGEGRTLILVYTGISGHAFMPTAHVLQHFPEERFDLLFLRDPRRLGFAMGMQGHSGSFADMLGRLDREVGFARYGEILTMGVSNGGAAALATAAMLGVRAAFCFCGRQPTTSTRYGDLAAAAELERLVVDTAGTVGTRRVLVHADNPQDHANTARLAGLAPSEVVGVGGVTNHNIFWELHQIGQLAPLFRAIRLLDG